MLLIVSYDRSKYFTNFLSFLSHPHCLKIAKSTLLRRPQWFVTSWSRNVGVSFSLYYSIKVIRNNLLIHCSGKYLICYFGRFPNYCITLQADNTLVEKQNDTEYKRKVSKSQHVKAVLLPRKLQPFQIWLAMMMVKSLHQQRPHLWTPGFIIPTTSVNIFTWVSLWQFKRVGLNLNLLSFPKTCSFLSSPFSPTFSSKPEIWKPSSTFPSTALQNLTNRECQHWFSSLCRIAVARFSSSLAWTFSVVF